MMNKVSKVVCIAVAGVMCMAIFAGCGKTKVEEPVPTPTPMVTQAPDPTPMPTPVPTPMPSAAPSASVAPSASADPAASADTAASADPAASSNPDLLKLKSEGDKVTKVQERLEKLGYLDTVTGYFGTDTEKAVKEFQAKNDLTVDGKVGSGTMDALMSDSAKKAS
ncbi:MAG: peptidoglycan-binding domain-containing protein [Christensenellaceae bacterium]